MSAPTYDPRDFEEHVDGRVTTPPAPGGDSAGPPLTDLVYELSRTRQALEQLVGRARSDSIVLLNAGVVGGQTDGSGDLALKLAEVPQGATGHLMLAAIDEAGVTPAAPDTAGTLWHAIYAGPPGSATAAQVIAVGNLMDCQPLTPAADAQIPHAYTYGERWGAPTLRGPQSFWLVIDGATASRQIAVRYAVLIEQANS